MNSLSLYYFTGITATIAQTFRLSVLFPFIDEQFHFAQCAVYCAHRFSEWNDKITTPPGLYLLGTAYSHFLSLLGFSNTCGYTALRSLNLLGGVIVLPSVLQSFHTNNFSSLNMISLPLLYTYYFLFYTDVWSSIFVVGGMAAVVSSPNAKGAVICNVLGFVGLWFRQTNILWIAFCACVLVEQRCAPRCSATTQLAEFVRQSWKDKHLLLLFVPNALFFALFLKINGGITFGDKKNHQLAFHIVQIFYCWTFVGALTLPLWLCKKTLINYRNFILGHKGLGILTMALSYAAIWYIVQNFTIVHPFLLADNRHYTFYIYRRILSKPWAKYLVVPVFHYFTWLIIYMLSQTRGNVRLSFVGITAFLSASAVTLIPSPLFEPRYFIVPLVLFRVFTQSQLGYHQVRNQMYEFLWYQYINAIVFIIFFNYKFTWHSEPGIQRIIW